MSMIYLQQNPLCCHSLCPTGPLNISLRRNSPCEAGWHWYRLRSLLELLMQTGGFEWALQPGLYHQHFLSPALALVYQQHGHGFVVLSSWQEDHDVGWHNCYIDRDGNKFRYAMVLLLPPHGMVEFMPALPVLLHILSSRNDKHTLCTALNVWGGIKHSRLLSLCSQ
jgi:hypothetical protein